MMAIGGVLLAAALSMLIDLISEYIDVKNDNIQNENKIEETELE